MLKKISVYFANQGEHMESSEEQSISKNPDVVLESGVLLDRRMLLAAEIERLSKEKAEIEDSIKAEMFSKGLNQAFYGRYKITYKTIETERINGKKLQMELPGIYSQFVTNSSTKRLTIYAA